MPDLTVSTFVDEFMQADDAAAARDLLGLAESFKGGIDGSSVPSTSPIAGDYYLITTAGTSQGKTWAVSDLAIYNGTAGSWTQIAGSLVGAVKERVLLSELPDPIAFAGREYIVSDDVGGQMYVYSDGATWRRSTDAQPPESWIPRNAVMAVDASAERFFSGVAALPSPGAFAAAVGSAGSEFGRLAETPADGVMIEEADTNEIRNTLMVAASSGSLVPSTGGQLPLYWNLSDSSAANLTVALSQPVSEALDITVTSTGTGYIFVQFDALLQILASIGEVWTTMVDLAIIAGSTTNVSSIRVGYIERSAGGGFQNYKAQSYRNLLGDKLQRCWDTKAVTAGTRVCPMVMIECSASGANITLRIARPKISKTTKRLSHITTYLSRRDRPADAPVINLGTRLDLGPEIVRNGSPVANTRFWSPNTNASLSASAGLLVVTSTTASLPYAEQAFPVEVGKTYRIRVKGLRTSPGSAAALVGTSSGGTQIANWSFSSSTLVEQTIDWVATVSVIYMRVGYGTTAAGQATSFSGISVRVVNPDYSFALSGVPQSSDGTLLHLTDASNNGLRIYRSTHQLLGVDVAAGVEGSPVTLGRCMEGMVSALTASVAIGGNISLAYNGKPAKTVTGGRKFNTAYLAHKSDGSNYWNAPVRDLVFFPIANTATVTIPELFDDFDRADGAIGTAWTGQAWSVVPATTTRVTPLISGGKLVAADSGQSQTAAYIGVDMGAPVKEMRALISFAAGISGGSAVLIATAGGVTVDAITAGSIHIVFADTVVNVDVFETGVLTTIKTLAYPAACAQDGTVYQVGWQIDGDTLTLFLPGGSLATITDSRFAQQNGAFAIFEHYWLTGRCHSTFHAVNAK